MTPAKPDYTRPGVRLIFRGTDHVGVPQAFARWVQEMFWMDWQGIDDDDIEVLLSGFMHLDYWSVWESVLSNCSFADINGQRWLIHHDGDVYAYCYELMSEHQRRYFGYEPTNAQDTIAA